MPTHPGVLAAGHASRNHDPDRGRGPPSPDCSWFRTGALLAARLGVIGVAVLVVTGASLTVTATVFDARQWITFIGGNLLLAATYALLGVCLGPLFGPVGGVFIAFLVPFLDIGIG